MLLAVPLRAPQPIREALHRELAATRSDGASTEDGWRHLERAHILSQPWAVDHVRVHAAMLRSAWKQRDGVEIRGQLIRLIVAGPGSALGRYPIGNTGRARVSATAPMPIDDTDIVTMLAEAGQPSHPGTVT
jgi:Protein of unknown function (DUF3703)